MSSNFRKKPLTAALAAGVLAAGALWSGAAAAAADGAGLVYGTAARHASEQYVPRQSDGTGPAFGTASRLPYASEAQAAQQQSDGTFHIVAVGDSITVGYKFGITDQAAIYGYADRVYEQALYHGRAESRNFGVLGLKSEGLRRWLEASRDGASITGEEAQPGITKYPLADETIGKSAALRSALEQADLVVMTIGGNDFLPLFDDLQQRQVPPDELKTRIDELLDTYKTSLTASLKAITDINPKAEIVFADQYLPVPDPKTNRLIKFVTEDQYAVLLEGTKKLRELVESVGSELRTEGFDARTVDLSEPFLGHELIYTSIVKGRGDSHPSDDGYEQIGEAFAETIWGEYRKPEALTGGSPLRIVVNGTNVDGPNKPALINGTTFLPMRDVAKALGASLTWDGKTKTATLRAGDKTVAFTIGAKTMKINGTAAPLETPAYLNKKSSATYLPLAALSKGLGYQVVYRKPILTVFINS